jgi:hypothetical protein
VFPESDLREMRSRLIHRLAELRDRLALLIRVDAIQIHPHQLAKDDRCCVYTIRGSSLRAPLPVGSSICIRCTPGQTECYPHSYVRPSFGVVYSVQLNSSALHSLPSTLASLPSPTKKENEFAAAAPILTRGKVIASFRGYLAWLFLGWRLFLGWHGEIEEWSPRVIQAGDERFLARCHVDPEDVTVAEIESLAKAADRLDRMHRLFFSFAAAFSSGAVSTANENNVALFQIHLNGRVTSENAQAEELRAQRAQFSHFTWRDLIATGLFFSGYLGLILGPWLVFGLAPTKSASSVYWWAGGLGTFCFLYLFYVLTGRDFGKFTWRVPGLLKVTASLLGVMASFAAVYLQLNHSHPDAFKPQLKGHLDALYFSVTTLSTVGFGDQKPASQACRAVVTGQMAVTLAIVAVGLSILSSRFASSVRQ